MIIEKTQTKRKILQNIALFGTGMIIATAVSVPVTIAAIPNNDTPTPVPPVTEKISWLELSPGKDVLLSKKGDSIDFKVGTNFDKDLIRGISPKQMVWWDQVKDIVVEQDTPDNGWECMYKDANGNYHFKLTLAADSTIDININLQLYWAGTVDGAEVKGDINQTTFKIVKFGSEVIKDDKVLDSSMTFVSGSSSLPTESDIISKYLAIDNSKTDNLSTMTNAQKRTWFANNMDANILAAISVIEMLHIAKCFAQNVFENFKFEINIEQSESLSPDTPKKFIYESEMIIRDNGGSVVPSRRISFNGESVGREASSCFLYSIGDGLSVQNKMVEEDFVDVLGVDLTGNFYGVSFTPDEAPWVVEGQFFFLTYSSWTVGTALKAFFPNVTVA